jgi:hypothetical protein
MAKNPANGKGRKEEKAKKSCALLRKGHSRTNSSPPSCIAKGRRTTVLHLRLKKKSCCVPDLGADVTISFFSMLLRTIEINALAGRSNSPPDHSTHLSRAILFVLCLFIRKTAKWPP